VTASLRLLLHRTVEQLVDLPLGLAFLGSCWLGKPSEQGRRSGDVLASPSELWKTVTIFHDPPVNVMGPGSCTPALSAALHDLTLELSTFFLQPAVCFLELMLPCL
jgi:hypothetical protein